MKNLSLALNAVLVVAVGVLYFLHFSTPKTAAVAADGKAANLKIAYINSDTVLKYYDYYKATVGELEKKSKTLDQDYRNRAQSLQNDINNYQRSLANMTIGQAKAAEEQLAMKQQNLRVHQERLAQEMMGEEARVTEELYKKVTGYLKKYGDANGLEIVMKFSPTSDVLYGNSSLDISQEVIKGLNEEFKAEQAAPAAKTDTTAVRK
ncbi:MAG: OmpH family outer membrane protein [Cyclobacteriaceae bacterium]|jgi:outer membrane protein|nr:OmpH family outer membrane protein [Cyclobacteriaceae bacterium]